MKNILKNNKRKLILAGVAAGLGLLYLCLFVIVAYFVVWDYQLTQKIQPDPGAANRYTIDELVPEACYTDYKCEQLYPSRQYFRDYLDYLNKSYFSNGGKVEVNFAKIAIIDDFRGSQIQNTFTVADSYYSKYEAFSSLQIAAHQVYMIAKFYPPQILDKISHIVLFTDGLNGASADVGLVLPGCGKNVLRLDQLEYLNRYYNSAHSNDRVDYEYILIHESAHIMSIRSDSFVNCDAGMYQKVTSCQTDILEGYKDLCWKADSALYRFYLEFWQGDNSRGLNYVSDYATQDVYEDFAESFYYYVWAPGQKNSNEKIAFFDDYPEYVELAEYFQSVMISGG